MVVSPCVQGMFGLTSAMTSEALSMALRVMSTEMPRLTRPWALGGVTCTSAMSRGRLPELNSLGTSERRMGV